MDTNEKNPNEMTGDQSNEGNVNENLEKRITDTIVALVNRANAIAEENNVIEKPQLYEDVKEATTYISETETKAGNARTKYNELENMPKAHFWTIGRNKAKVEKTQNVLHDVIDAIDNNALASKALFNNQVKMVEKVKELYAIALMGVAANRMVVREIKARLERASKEELSQLARQELENVINELKLQQRIIEKVDGVETKVNEAINKHVQLAEHVDENQADVLAKIEATNKDMKSSNELFETKLNEAINKHNQLAEHVDENQADVLARIEAANKDMKSSNEQFEAKLNEVKDEGKQRAKKTEESFQTLKGKSEIHEKRLDILEKKSFFDSSVYKILVGVVAVGALVISLINYFR